MRPKKIGEILLKLGNFERQRSSLRLKFYIVLIAIFLVPFQNCGEVRVASQSLRSVPDVVVANSVSYLNIETDSTKTFRTAFLVDMSNSMFAGACPDSLDTLVNVSPLVNPSPNCISPSGVDPEGKRFQVMIQWLKDMKERIGQSQGKLSEDQFKILIVPYSMTPVLPYYYGAAKDYWSLDNYLLKKLISDAGVSLIVDRPNQVSQFTHQFVSITDAIKISYLLWALDNRFHAYPYDPQIPANLVGVAETASFSTQNLHASSGASQPAPGMEIMINQLSAELTDLKTKNAVAGSHFELIFLSDGVPKPHPLHIEAMVKMIWNTKTTICDPVAIDHHHCKVNPENQIGWKTVTGGKNCAAVCKNYLQQYLDTGSVQLGGADKPLCINQEVSCGLNGYCWNSGCRYYSDGSTDATRWGTDIKCAQCMDLINQFDYTKSSSQGFHTSSLRDKTSTVWGDWTLNRHPFIIQKLKTMQNMFNLQFPGAQWRFNFVRVDSDKKENKIQAGELVKDLNWMVKAEDYYKKTQRFGQITTAKIPFDLFYEVSRDQEYALGVIYAYNRTYHLGNNGALALESLNKRTDGMCLDSIKNRFSNCIRPPSCDPAIDADGDGLNQCEEITLGTNDRDPDSDRDGILDGAEVLFGFSPLTNDRDLVSPIDHQSNFDHFVKGAPPLVNLLEVPKVDLIDLSTQLFDYKDISTLNGSTYRSPGYHIVLKNIPIKSGIANEIVIIARADNLSSPNDSRWIGKVYKVNSLSGSIEIKIEEFEDLKKLNLGIP